MSANDRLHEAAEWHVTLESDTLTDGDIQKFRQWRSDPDNAHAFREIEKTWGAFEIPAAKSGRLIIQGLLDDESRFSGRRSLRNLLPFVPLVALTSVLVAGFAGYFANVPLLHSDFLLADHRSVSGAPPAITLEDGSKLRLRGLSAVDVLYTPDKRHIDLSLGELQVTVAHDPDRPLIVRAGDVTATAEGTQYSVQRRDDRVQVSVTESVVRVCHKVQQELEREVCVRVHAGETVSVDDRGISEIESVSTGITYDWESGYLMVPGQLISEVLAELKRQHTDIILYDTQALETYFVSGRFPLNDLRKTFDLLRQSAPLTVRYPVPFVVNVEPSEISE
ncbi:MAG: hypothetical protein CMI67_22830 [Pelagibaca sp.]|nr:hypothetical protein [Pelagibaca sp.]